jgi:hypothetical protein
MSAVAPRPRTEPERADQLHAVETAWHALAVVQASVTSMEESATRIVAAQLAGLIALWTQLFTWHDPVPRGFAWAAWSLLVVSLLLLAPVVTPRRLARFWTSILPAAAGVAAAAPQPALELAVVEELLETFMGQRSRMARGLRRSIVLSALALVLVVTSYALEKA